MSRQRDAWNVLLVSGEMGAEGVAERLGIATWRALAALERLRAIPAVIRRGRGPDAIYAAIADAVPCAMDRRLSNLTHESKVRGGRVSAERSRAAAAERREKLRLEEPKKIAKCLPVPQPKHALDIAWPRATAARFECSAED